MKDGDTRDTIVELARLLAARGALSLSLHGNISVRLEQGDRILMTGSSLAELDRSSLAVVALDGTVIDGHVSPTELEVLPMHLRPYAARDDLRCLIHTHSPSATTFAVCGRELPVVAESLARWGIARPLPVAGWAPRGSDDSVTNIVTLLEADRALVAVLLANHGILVGGSSPLETARRVIAVEENAQLALGAMALGGATPLDEHAIAAATERRTAFAPTDRSS
jgi:L-ribulose-5-phosphate 4-epimerase